MSMLLISMPQTIATTHNESAFVLRISGTPESVTVAPIVEVAEPPIPDSFLAGWADYQAGRVVDMEQALGDEQPPPV
jgi:hypothetical protein